MTHASSLGYAMGKKNVSKYVYLKNKLYKIHPTPKQSKKKKSISIFNAYVTEN